MRRVAPQHRALIISGLLFGVFVLGCYVVSCALSPALVSISFIGIPQHKVASALAVNPARPENTLYIQKIGLIVPIVEGDTPAVMTQGAWHREPQNGDPAHGGNFVLSAHRFVMSYSPGSTIKRSPFYNIDKLAVGDDIVVDYGKMRYHFVVDSLFHVSETQTSIESRTKEPVLTLYSCSLRGSRDGREVIRAKMVSAR